MRRRNGCSRQVRWSTVLAERAHKTNPIVRRRAVLVPCAQLRTNDPVSWKETLRGDACYYRAVPGWRNVVVTFPLKQMGKVARNVVKGTPQNLPVAWSGKEARENVVGNPGARRGRAIGMCSLDARGEGSTMPLAWCRKRREFGANPMPCSIYAMHGGEGQGVSLREETTVSSQSGTKLVGGLWQACQAGPG
jgi:hypothetical protein